MWGLRQACLSTEKGGVRQAREENAAWRGIQRNRAPGGAFGRFCRIRQRCGNSMRIGVVNELLSAPGPRRCAHGYAAIPDRQVWFAAVRVRATVGIRPNPVLTTRRHPNLN